MRERKSAHAIKPDDPAEYQCFLDIARDVETAKVPGAVHRALDKVIRPRRLGTVGVIRLWQFG